MGKYALMKGSLIQTVLYNSNINREKGPFLPKGKDVSLDSFTDGKYKNRFLGRTVLGTHEIDGTKYTKEGWYGSPHEVQTKNLQAIQIEILLQNPMDRGFFCKRSLLREKQ